MKQQSKVRAKMIDEFISSLKEDVIPWHRGWDVSCPYNPVSHTKYKGINSFWLMCVANELKFDDPRWLTFKQAESKGYKIKKDSKGTLVEFWAPYDCEERKILTPREVDELYITLGGEGFKERVRYLAKSYTVFNGSQIEGLPKLKKKDYHLSKNELLDKRDTLLANMKIHFSGGGNEACYVPSLDKICMPLMTDFHSDYEYMATFLHECAHATAHPSRLNRKLGFLKGSEEYAKEELRAEIASAFTASETGIVLTQNDKMENHKAYVQNWISVLENEPKALFDAIKDAEKISDYLLEKGEFEKFSQPA